MDNQLSTTVYELLNRNLRLIVPKVIVRENGGGQIYSGPITTIPQNIQSRTYETVEFDRDMMTCIIILKGVAEP